VTLLFTLLSLLACAGAPDDTGTVASLNILSPAEEATVCGTPLVILTEVENFMLVAPGDGTEELPPGTGHIDVAVNGQEQEDWMFGGEELVLPEVGDGYWRLQVELSNADHSAIAPYAGDTVYVTIDATVCE